MFRNTRFAFLFLLFQLAVLSQYAQTANTGKDTTSTIKTAVIPFSPNSAPPGGGGNQVVCTVRGATTVAGGSTQSYSLNCSAGISDIVWGVSGGTIIGSATGPGIIVQWKNDGTTSGNVTGGQASGIGSGAINVTITYPQLVAGSISPSSQTVNYNTVPGILSISGMGGGNNSYTYQWQSSPDPSFSSVTNIGGGGTTFSPGNVVSTLYYRVAVKSIGITAYSPTAVVNVYPQIQPGSVSPDNQSINYNTNPGTLTLSGVTGGNGSYTYQWYSIPPGGTNWNLIPGAVTTIYSPGNVTSTTYYMVVVSSNGVTGESGHALVTVYPPLQPGSISPVSPTINYNTDPGALTLSGVSGGNGSYTYQWYSAPFGTTSWNLIPGAVASTYSPGNMTVSTYYMAIVSSNGATGESGHAQITVYPQLQPGSISSSSQSINYNTTPAALSLSGVSGGSGSYTYQWQSSPDISFSSPTNIGSGGTSFAPGNATSTLYYRVAVTSNGVTSYSATGLVTVYGQLAAGAISPANQSIAYNTAPATLILSGVSGGNGSYIYQWQSSPDPSFSTLTNVGSGGTTFDPGNETSTLYYRVMVTSNEVIAYSSPEIINVAPPLLTGGTITGNTGPISFNKSPGLFGSSQDATGGSCSGNYSYQWQYSVDGTNYRNIVQAVATTYTPANLAVSTYFRRQVSCGSASAYSNVNYVQVTAQRAANCTP